ncbi:hypothetical protein RMDY18_13560 [Rothia mucilaginosa DY-18]|uniref:Uncharacterized protein n=1 Tax=Rothia mucilaginosa (strain DY-18) TaxID=680646 RepID=D2NU62_ROTMD|nr:hypothetical protein RMDY18_13560 [Rothia mucilaginosa DY-18]
MSSVWSMRSRHTGSFNILRSLGFDRCSVPGLLHHESATGRLSPRSPLARLIGAILSKKRNQLRFTGRTRHVIGVQSLLHNLGELSRRTVRTHATLRTLHSHRHQELWILNRRHTNEGSRVAVIATLLTRSFRSTGLTAHAVAGHLRRRGVALLHHILHESQAGGGSLLAHHAFARLHGTLMFGTVGVNDRVHNARLQTNTLIAQRLENHGGLQRSLRHTLTEEHGVLLAAVPIAPIADQALLLAGQLDAGELAHAVLLEPVVTLLLGELLTHEHGAGVHRVGNNAREGTALRRVLERVLEGLPVNREGCGYVVHARGGREALLNQRRGGQHFLGRTGLHVLRNSARSHVRRILNGCCPRVHRRGISESQNGAVTHIHNNGGTPFSLQLLSAGAHNLLGEVLDVSVNGQTNILTVHRQALLFLSHRNTHTISTNLVGALTGGTGKLLLEDTLNAHREVTGHRATLAVAVSLFNNVVLADHGATHTTVGVQALGERLTVDEGRTQSINLIENFRGDICLNHRVLGGAIQLGLDELIGNARVNGLENINHLVHQLVGGDLNLLGAILVVTLEGRHGALISGQVITLHSTRHDIAVDIQNLAAHSRQHLGAQTLLTGRIRHRTGIKALADKQIRTNDAQSTGGSGAGDKATAGQVRLTGCRFVRVLTRVGAHAVVLSLV